eukprot:SAG31_NODE_297_length_18175_cov_68.266659_13_plen_230_part_00
MIALHRWWNRTHLDYALAPSSLAFHPSISFQASDLDSIGLLPSWYTLFDSSRKGLRPAGSTIHSESADRAFGLYLEPSFGISFPTNPGPLAPILPSAFAVYRNVDLGGSEALTHVRMRGCVPDAASKIKPATAVLLREGSPYGQLLVRIDLSVASLSHANCGYLIGSYWLPGVMNDDPTAMTEVRAPLTSGSTANIAGARDSVGVGRYDVYLSIEGGGHVAIDWFRFEV